MVLTLFSDANTLNIFSGGSLLPGHTVRIQEAHKVRPKPSRFPGVYIMILLWIP